MSVSIYDIAKKARVAPSTVSRALEDHPRIGAETKQRIQALAQEMGYIPSTVAKSLAANSGFMADPNLFRTRWVVGVPVAPLRLPPGARLRVQLTQTEPINASFSPVPRVRLLASSDAPSGSSMVGLRLK